MCSKWGENRAREWLTYFFLFRKTPKLSKWVIMCVSMPDDKMLKYGAYWTKLRVQNPSWESDDWGPKSEAIAITTNVNIHYPRRRLITVLSMREEDGNKLLFKHHREMKDAINKRRKPTGKCFGEQEQKWPRPYENIVVGKVKWCWTAVVSAQREGEGPAVLWRRQHSVEPNLHSHIVSWLIHKQD